MKNDQIKKLCMDLLVSDSEDEVISLLKNAGLWEDSNLWRLYGDKEGNFAQAGNQQALPEAALVEKLVNCCDARLMCECLLQNIGPESVEAPVSVRDASHVSLKAVGPRITKLAHLQTGQRQNGSSSRNS